MDALIDWFGKDFRIVEEGEGQMCVTLRCNEQAMKYWALQYGGHIEILAPQSLRTAVRDAVEIPPSLANTSIYIYEDCADWIAQVRKALAYCAGLRERERSDAQETMGDYEEEE